LIYIDYNVYAGILTSVSYSLILEGAVQPNIKVFIVDGHPIVRQVLKMQLELAQGIIVIGNTDTTPEAISLITEQKPDVVLVDTDMPGIDGVSITQELHLAFPQIPLLVLSLTGDAETCKQAITAGAAGFIQKNADPTELINTLRRIASIF
jgi:two-component system, NarL family, nitrate/nitrite response regulator NarL